MRTGRIAERSDRFVSLMFVLRLFVSRLSVMHAEIHHILPAHNPFLPVEASPQLPFRLNHLSLQDSVLDDVLTVLGLYSRQPDTLCGLALDKVLPLPADQKVPVCHTSCLHLFSDRSTRLCTSINHDVCTVLVSANMADEVNAYASRPLIVETTEES